MSVQDIVALARRLAKGERLLGLDVGAKTVGLALSDRGLTVASPLETLKRGKLIDDVAALVESLSGTAPRSELVDAVAAMTEGNPFFVKEVVGLLIDEGKLEVEAEAEVEGTGALTLSLPQGVRDAVGRRLGLQMPRYLAQNTALLGSVSAADIAYCIAQRSHIALGMGS